MATSTRPSFDSLKSDTSVGRGAFLFKEAQDMPPGAPPGGIEPAAGQSPVTGNPDEMQAPESANQKQFEDDFGSLAYQFVQDRAPGLVPYMLGFEVVDRNEDGSKAVGIFGYKVGKDFYYIPAFFLNNQVRGIDMILNKKTNQFLPLIEKWIDFILSKHEVQIGGPADDRVRETMRTPDLSFVQRPQVALGKIAEDGNDAPWTPREAWGHIKSAFSSLMKDEAFREMLSGLGGSVRGKAEKRAESKYVRDFMEKVGGPEAMSSLFKAMHDVGFANAAMKLYDGPEAFWTEKLAGASVHVDRMRKIAAAKPKVRVVDSVKDLAKVAQDSAKGDTPKTDVGDPDLPLTEEENARQIVERDFTIEDMRPDEETSRVTDDKVLVEFEHRFQPPEAPGKYSFMMSDGVTREGVMLNAVLSPSCAKNNTFVVFEDDGNVLAEAEPRALLTTGTNEDKSEADPLKDLYGKADNLSEVEIGDRGGTPYLFINDKGDAVGPFFISAVFEDNGHTRLATCFGCDDRVLTRPSESLTPGYGFMDWDLSDRYHDFDGRRALGGCCCAPCSTDGLISIGSTPGKPVKTRAGVLIPSDWKALKLRRLRRPPMDYSPDAEERIKEQAKSDNEYAELCSKYTFGTPDDVIDYMRTEGIERIKVASDGTEFYVSVSGAPRPHGPMNYKAAAVDLVTRFGLRPRRAFAALNKAASGEPAKMLLGIPWLKQGFGKAAQDGLVNVAMPYPLDQIPQTDPYSGVPVYNSPYVDITRGQFTGVPALPPEGGMTHGINIGGEMERLLGGEEVPDEHDSFDNDVALPIDEEARRLAEEAAAAGQRHVFDQATIGGLAKVYDTANVVDSYIPEFMDTIDRLGRILFLFYWKHEDFNQRYGSDDVVQMEDRLRSVFKQMGELTLQLKEKAVQKD